MLPSIAAADVNSQQTRLTELRTDKGAHTNLTRETLEMALSDFAHDLTDLLSGDVSPMLNRLTIDQSNLWEFERAGGTSRLDSPGRLVANINEMQF